MPSEITKQIQQLIASARIEDALKLLIQHLPPSNQNEGLALQSRLSNLNKQSRMGLLHSGQEGVERAQITYAALELCKMIQPPAVEEKEPEKGKEAQPTHLFISYAHRDEAYKDDLNIHLSTLRRQKIIEAWQDREIVIGDEWDATIEAALRKSKIVLFLVSPHFLDSDYIHRTEIKIALEMYEERLCKIVPIVIRPCDWQTTDLSKFQALPRNAKPVSKWDDQDEAWMNVVQELRRLLGTITD